MKINWTDTKQDIFLKRKEELIQFANNLLEKDGQEDEGLRKLIEILNKYSFENRLNMKGFLSHAIIDSLDIDYSLAEKCIIFDNAIR